MKICNAMLSTFLFRALLMSLLVLQPVHGEINPFATDKPAVADAAASSKEKIATIRVNTEKLALTATPAKTLDTFMEAMTDYDAGEKAALETALQCLNLEKINPIIRKTKGENWAWQLYQLLLEVDVKRPPTEKALKKSNQLSVKIYQQGKHHVNLQRQTLNFDDGPHSIEQHRWLFSQASLESLDTLLDNSEHNRNSHQVSRNKPIVLKLIDHMPEEYKQLVFGVHIWQWAGLFLFVVIGLLADLLFVYFSRHLIQRYSEQKNIDKSSIEVPSNLIRPFGFLLMSIIWWVGIKQLLLPESVLLVLTVSVQFLMTLFAVWSAYRIVDIFNYWLSHRASLTEHTFDDALIPLIRRTLKVFVTVVGIVFMAELLQVNITSLLAGLGLGGLAFALAAKDIAQNLLGTVSILLERTFSVGDWVLVNGIEGTVEDISFRSTRIRTFYDSMVTVPNGNIITNSVDNYGKRRYRRMNTKLGLTYQTPPDKIEAFCEGIREIVRLHPHMRKDTFHVYFNGYADSALEIMVYVFWRAPDWSTELRERHKFLLDILRLAHALEVDFAYPTQTLYWKDAEKLAAIPQEKMKQDEAYEHARQAAQSIVKAQTDDASKP